MDGKRRGGKAGERELYRQLVALSKDKSSRPESAAFVSSLLADGSERIRAKALWLLGETGLKHPSCVRGVIPSIAAFCDSPAPLLRERALNALGRIGRGEFQAIEPYWKDLFRFAADEQAKVRLSFIWASENIATNTPDIYEVHMPVYERLLYDEDDRVRMEAPEMFRVIGKRRPEFVRAFGDELRKIAQTDTNPVVRIHCMGAVRAMTDTRKV